jgi:probable rRNA maturation factor
VQVEVSVQDCFFTASRAAATGAALSPCPISTSTWESWFYQWLETLQPALPPADAYELSLRLTDDPEIQELNAQYRHKNQPTDVLAFASLEVHSPELPLKYSCLCRCISVMSLSRLIQLIGRPNNKGIP